MKKEYWIVWNPSKSEGFVTDDYRDALSASDGESGSSCSTIGQEFFEAYGEDYDFNLPLQILEIDPTEAQ